MLCISKAMTEEAVGKYKMRSKYLNQEKLNTKKQLNKNVSDKYLSPTC